MNEPVTITATTPGARNAALDRCMSLHGAGFESGPCGLCLAYYGRVTSEPPASVRVPISLRPRGLSTMFQHCRPGRRIALRRPPYSGGRS